MAVWKKHKARSNVVRGRQTKIRTLLNRIATFGLLSASGASFSCCTARQLYHVWVGQFNNRVELAGRRVWVTHTSLAHILHGRNASARPHPKPVALAHLSGECKENTSKRIVLSSILFVAHPMRAALEISERSPRTRKHRSFQGAGDPAHEGTLLI